MQVWWITGGSIIKHGHSISLRNYFSGHEVYNPSSSLIYFIYNIKKIFKLW
jgi:hypothetical protein